MLLGLCLLAGVVAAGMAFPFAAGLGVLSNDAGDGVNNSSTDLLDGALPPLRTTILDSTGQPLAYLFDQNRQSVTADQISPAMKAAIVAIEDRRFYQHQASTGRARCARSSPTRRRATSCRVPRR